MDIYSMAFSTRFWRCCIMHRMATAWWYHTTRFIFWSREAICRYLCTTSERAWKWCPRRCTWWETLDISTLAYHSSQPCSVSAIRYYSGTTWPNVRTMGQTEVSFVILCVILHELVPRFRSIGDHEALLFVACVCCGSRFGGRWRGRLLVGGGSFNDIAFEWIIKISFLKQHLAQVCRCIITSYAVGCRARNWDKKRGWAVRGMERGFFTTFWIVLK